MKPAIRTVIALALVGLAVATPAAAQEASLDGSSVSFAIGEQRDALTAWVGYGSPLVFGSAQARIELGGAVVPVLSGGLETWEPFWAVRAGLSGYGDWVGGAFRAYGSGGVLFAFPGTGLSDASFAFGGWGAFGLEFRTLRAGVFFVELGTTGSEATAELADGAPRFLNGFCTSAGLRFYP
ncbi:MAG: hypothetical protein KBC36_12410 [Spirochaetia bacterium]|nr:hypothetical protein [Spirochaetia bacterium]